jgi:hypothetical protein
MTEMKKLFCVTAMNHEDHHRVTYDNVYDIKHLWDEKHDSLRLLMQTGMDSIARCEFINMNENDILIVQESV